MDKNNKQINFTTSLKDGSMVDYEFEVLSQTHDLLIVKPKRTIAEMIYNIEIYFIDNKINMSSKDFESLSSNHLINESAPFFKQLKEEALKRFKNFIKE